jgi:hypothetical protein
VASPGTAGLAVETWAEAASMAPCGWIVGSGAYCAWRFGPLKQPSRHRRRDCLSIGKILLISGEGDGAIRRARLKLPGPDRQGRPVSAVVVGVCSREWRRSCATESAKESAT